MNPNTCTDRVLLQLISFTFILQIFLSSPLWLNRRVFPLVPIVDGAVLPAPFDGLLLMLLLGLLALNLVMNSVYLETALLWVLLISLVQDLNRWQPWTYLYFLAFAVQLINRLFIQSKQLLKEVFRIMIIAAFFWSGVAKFNTHFLEGTFLLVLESVFQLEDLKFFHRFAEIGWSIPLIEISAALLLCFRSTRNLGIGLALGTHLFIIYFVSPLGIGRDAIVIPWNILMMIVVIVVFYQAPDLNMLKAGNRWERWLKRGMVVLMLALPSFNLIGQWDDFLSFNLYADKNRQLLIVVDELHFNKLDRQLQQRFTTPKTVAGGKMLHLIDWAFAELKTPYYPEKRVIEAICHHFCQFGIPDESLVFWEFKGALVNKNQRTFHCSDLP